MLKEYKSHFKSILIIIIIIIIIFIMAIVFNSVSEAKIIDPDNDTFITQPASSLLRK